MRVQLAFVLTERTVSPCGCVSRLWFYFNRRVNGLWLFLRVRDRGGDKKSDGSSDGHYATLARLFDWQPGRMGRYAVSRRGEPRIGAQAGCLGYQMRHGDAG